MVGELVLPPGTGPLGGDDCDVGAGDDGVEDGWVEGGVEGGVGGGRFDGGVEGSVDGGRIDGRIGGGRVDGRVVGGRVVGGRPADAGGAGARVPGSATAPGRVDL